MKAGNKNGYPDEFYFDDCEICKVMKVAHEQGREMSSGELHTVFEKQNKKNNKNLNMIDKDELYYDAMELLDMQGKGGVKKAEQLLLEALKIDPDYVQTNVGLIGAYEIGGNKKKFEEMVQRAYDLTVKEFPKWPKELLWGFLENRAYLRAIQYRADLYADEKNNNKAIELYKLLLKLNPNDNQGARYTLAGIYAGISGEKINEMFDEGNEKQNWSKLEKLVKDQNNKHHFWKEPKYD